MNVLTSMLAASALATAAGVAAAPPLSGAIKRTEPMRYKVQIAGIIEVKHDSEKPSVTGGLGAPLLIPYLKDGAYHELDMPDPEKYLIVLRRFFGPVVTNPAKKYEIVSMGSLETNVARIDTPMDLGQKLEFVVQQFETVYNAKVDENALRRELWPQSWPADAQAALSPQMYIESDDAKIIELLKEWTGDEPHSVGPFLFGKELARRVTQAFQVSGFPVLAQEEGLHRAINVKGAVAAATSRIGTVHDRVCLFVALCRAAGLPARAVIGVNVHSRLRVIISWAEFFVPHAGWISVDFDQLQGVPGIVRNIDQSWPGLGTDKHLNERLPLAYHYYPPAGYAGTGPVEQPLLWSWAAFPNNFFVYQKMDIDIDRAPRPHP